MAAGKGLYRYIKLFLDKASAKQMEADSQEALDKSTDPKKAAANLSKTESAFTSLKTHALKIAGAIAGAFAFKKIADFGIDSIKTAAEAEKIWSELGTTVAKTGRDFAAMRPEIEAAADAWMEATPFDDEDYAKGLKTLIQLTRNYSGSVKNMGLVADIAAAQNIDVAEAADKVGKVMNGDLKTLKEFGIKTTDVNEAMRVLSETFSGKAAAAVDTFDGKLRQLGGAWDNVKEAIGNALLEGGEGTSLLDTLIASTRALTKWIEENKQPLKDFASDLVAAAKALAELVGWMVKANAEVSNPSAVGVNLGKRFRHWMGWDKEENDEANAQKEKDERQKLIDDLAKQAAAGAKKIGDAETEAERRARERLRNEREKEAAKEKARRKKEIDAAAEDARIKAQAAFLPPELRLKHPGLVSSMHGAPLPAAGAAGLVDPRLLEHLDNAAEHTAKVLENVQDITLVVLAGVMDAWQDFFTMMGEGFDNTGEAAKAFAKGVAAALIGGVEAYASRKAKEAALESGTQIAMAIGAAVTPGMQGSVAGHIASAAKFAAIATGWAALAGAGGAGRNALGGGGHPSTSNDDSGRLSGQLDTVGPEIHIHVDGVDPSNARHQALIGETTRRFARRGGRIIFEGA